MKTAAEMTSAAAPATHRVRAAAEASSARAHAARAPSPPARAALRKSSGCACGGGCPRCVEGSASSSLARTALAPKKRPEVVVEPKTELNTPAFSGSPELVAVMKGRRYVSHGNVGEYVKLVQEALLSSEAPRADGSRTRLPKFGVDGVFGPETKAAVQEFQREYGLADDGIVGQQTLYWLDNTFRSYLDRPDPAAGKKLPERFARKASNLTALKSLGARMTVDKAVTAAALPFPQISAKVTFTAEAEGTPGDKIFYVQNIVGIVRKVHWKRTQDCKAQCEEARAFVGKAQGLDTKLPYGLSVVLTGGKDKAVEDDEPTAAGDERHNPKGDFRKGDSVTLFAHDRFRTFLAHGAGGAFDFSSFDALGFFDWQWRGKASFTFDGTAWSVGSVERRIDPAAAPFDTSAALVHLGPLYLGEDVDTNLRSARTKIDETPDSW
ncbi:MAG TPA: peptidoglycan-binding domain-containing protein [Pyrinomonadaceae bacterium]|nr:peptidoglycan-binding domain-containing protein [Pyrinomonadaceae bacterium]